VHAQALVWLRSVNETKGINSSRINDTTVKFTDTQPYCYLYAARLVYDRPLVERMLDQQTMAERSNAFHSVAAAAAAAATFSLSLGPPRTVFALHSCMSSF
jgi:hypothetical protein